MFCDDGMLAEAFLDIRKRKNLVKKFKNMSDEAKASAIERAPADYRTALREAAHRSKWCNNGEECVYGVRGGRVRLREGSHCLLCSPTMLSRRLGARNGITFVANKVRKIARDKWAHEIDSRVPEEHRRVLSLRLGLGRDASPQQDEDRAAKRIWDAVVRHRQCSLSPPTEDEAKKYRSEVLEDRARARRTMRVSSTRIARGAPADKDTSLPPAKRYKLADDLRFWCNFNSWRLYENCGVPNPIRITPESLTLSWIHCFRALSASTVRNVSPEAAAALSPLEVDIGRR